MTEGVNKTHEAYGKIMASLVKWGLSLLLGMLITYYTAIVLGYHWNWFFAADGWAEPSFRARIGLSVVIMLFFLKPLTLITIDGKSAEKFGESEATVALVRYGFLAAGVTLSWGMGWLWNWWLG